MSDLLEKAQAKLEASERKPKPTVKKSSSVKKPAIKVGKKTTTSKAITTTKAEPIKKPLSKTSKIIGFFGKQGTGKTKSAMDFEKLGKLLYLDSEKKAHVIFNERYSDCDIDIISFRQVDQRYRINKLLTVLEFMKNTPDWVKLLESGKYKVCVIDNCDIFRPFAKYKWLEDNPKRVKPQAYEWGEIEEIVQDILYPFINVCRDYDIILILCYGIKDLYLNDVMIGTTEDAKQWLLGELDIELWLEWDYKKYCIKHPYKPFWEYRDEDENLSDYIFDKDFIDDYVEFKEYNQFKEETLISDAKKKELKRVREERKLTLK